MNFGGPNNPVRSILCIGAHCDDIEIGCGATILRLLEENPGLKITWVVLSSTPQRRKEALRASKLFLKDLTPHRVLIKNFRDSYFPYYGSKIKDFISGVRFDPSPDLIFTHCRGDLHQDHRLVSELTWNAFRDHMILEYEIPKYDGDLGSPNLFVEISESLVNQKIRHVLDAFQTQVTKSWFTEDTLRALLRIRGVEAASKKKFAEAFYCRKLLL
jgi:LmbE family N-acetylglucosaminyl deacetylase